MALFRSSLATTSVASSLRSIGLVALRSFRHNRSIYNLARNSCAALSRQISSISSISSTRWSSSLLRSRIDALTTRQSPTSVSTYLFAQKSGMKTRSSVKRLCDGCKVRTIFFLLVFANSCQIQTTSLRVLFLTMDDILQPVRRKNRVYIIWYVSFPCRPKFPGIMEY